MVAGVLVVVTTLVGCGGPPFTVAPAADDVKLSSEAGIAVPLEDDAGQLAVTAEASASDLVGDAGSDEAEAGKFDAGPQVNAFPGTPYAAPTCRSGADCVGDCQSGTCTSWPDGESPIPFVCAAFEGVGGDTTSSLLNGEVKCYPAEDVSGDMIVLCQSDLDCSGYSCVTEECNVATYAPLADGGGIPVQSGVTPIVISYCSGLGKVPACN